MIFFLYFFILEGGDRRKGPLNTPVKKHHSRVWSHAEVVRGGLRYKSQLEKMSIKYSN